MTSIRPARPTGYPGTEPDPEGPGDHGGAQPFGPDGLFNGPARETSGEGAPDPARATIDLVEELEQILRGDIGADGLAAAPDTGEGDHAAFVAAMAGPAVAQEPAEYADDEFTVEAEPEPFTPEPGFWRLDDRIPDEPARRSERRWAPRADIVIISALALLIAGGGAYSAFRDNGADQLPATQQETRLAGTGGGLTGSLTISRPEPAGSPATATLPATPPAATEPLPVLETTLTGAPPVLQAEIPALPAGAPPAEAPVVIADAPAIDTTPPEPPTADAGLGGPFVPTAPAADTAPAVPDAALPANDIAPVTNPLPPAANETAPATNPAAPAANGAAPATNPTPVVVNDTPPVVADPPVAADPAPPAGNTGAVRTNSWVNMRSGPDNDAAVVTVVPAGAEVEVGRCNYWCAVTYNGRSGYIFQDFLVGAPRDPA